MATGDNESDELEKLLADVRRTIRENDLFVRDLKLVSVESDAEGASEVEQNGDEISEIGTEFEEL